MLQRSCWKIPKSAMTAKDDDGNAVPAFTDLIVYDESTMYVYAMSATWDRPDIAAVGTREDLSKTASRTRFLRTWVRRPAGEEDDAESVIGIKASAVKSSDEVLLDVDVPYGLFAGDVADDVIGPEALAEAARLITEERAPALLAEEKDPPEGP